MPLKPIPVSNHLTKKPLRASYNFMLWKVMPWRRALGTLSSGQLDKKRDDFGKPTQGRHHEALLLVI